MWGAGEKRCTAGGDVILKQYCPPEERKAGQNTENAFTGREFCVCLQG